MDAHLLSNWMLNEVSKFSNLGRLPNSILFVDDFDSETLHGWESPAGTITRVAVSGRSNRQAATGGTTGDLAQLMEDAAALCKPWKAANSVTLKFGLILETADASLIHLLVGLSSVSPAGSEAVPPQFVGFEVDDADDADNFVAVCNDGGPPTVVDTGIAVDTSFHDFEIQLKTGEAKFFIDGALVATITTDVTADDLMRCLSIETRENSAHNFQVDYYGIFADRG